MRLPGVRVQGQLLPDRPGAASLSHFRQKATSPKRLLAFIRSRLDCTGACEAFARASFRRRDRRCKGGLTSDELT
jgi:hypothetical protein